MKFFPGLLISFAFLFNTTLFAQVKKVDAPGMTVKDMNTSVKFYSEVLGFKKISDKNYRVRLMKNWKEYLDCIPRGAHAIGR